MDQEIKAQWVAELRSGKHEQGKNYLNANGKLCCLGVLCEVAIQAGKAVNVRTTGAGATVYKGTDDRYPDDSERMALPAGVREWAGLDTISPDVTTEHASLADLNDSGEWNFNQIADLIEAEF